MTSYGTNGMIMIRYCNHCGGKVEHLIPAGDSRARHVCEACGNIQYENPRLVVGCVATWENRILLCRRAIEPRRGYWTLPAGFMENGETTADAARRETQEEAGASIAIDALFSMSSIAHINQVHLFYRGHLTSSHFEAGEESLEVMLVAPKDIPWQEIAFRSVTYCLQHYLEDIESGTFGFHENSLPPLDESH